MIVFLTACSLYSLEKFSHKKNTESYTTFRVQVIFGIENIFYKYRNLADINKKATPYYLRHSFATELLNNVADIRDIQELLGHSSINTTEIYLYVSATRKKEVLSNFGYKF